MKSFVSYLLIASAILCGCTDHSSHDKHQKNRNNCFDVSQNVKEILIEEPIISDQNRIMVASDYWVITDFKSPEKQIHIFEKKNFNHLISIANFGPGPTEISRIGHTCFDEESNSILILDHGQMKLVSYQLDSVLSLSSYIPTNITKLNKNRFPNKFFKFDNNYIGTIITPKGENGFNQSIGKWDITTGSIQEMKYQHPDVEKSRIALAVSNEHKIFATCQHLYDLISICDFQGNLKYNIHGPQWEPKIRKGNNQLHYWSDIEFCKDKIIASFSGKNYHGNTYFPTSFVIFDLEGNYVKTLEVGYNIVDFCYDNDNNRIIMAFDDEIQFGYLDMDEWL